MSDLDADDLRTPEEEDIGGAPGNDSGKVKSDSEEVSWQLGDFPFRGPPSPP
jgi:hypothetical protein